MVLCVRSVARCFEERFASVSVLCKSTRLRKQRTTKRKKSGRLDENSARKDGNETYNVLALGDAAHASNLNVFLEEGHR